MKFLYKDSLISQKQILSIGKKLKDYTKLLQEVSKKNNYEDNESSINCPFDKKAVSEVKKLVKDKVSKKLKYIIVIGIGGSNLGTKAVYDALRVSKKRPEIIFIDTTSTSKLINLRNFIKKEIKHKDEILVCSISKSGGTAETIANTEIVMNMLKFKNSEDRLVVITDEASKYWISARKKKISTLTIPKLVGGRYSVLSSVGLFPLLASGINIDKILDGARRVRSLCTQNNVKKNPAMLSSVILYTQNKKGRVINDNFVFNSELESLGKWYRQLMGESVGKEKNLKGKKVNSGLTPTVSVGSTDLHSVGQLYLGGPKDKITTFIYSKSVKEKVVLPKKRIFPELVRMVSGKGAKDILQAILEGTKIAYRKKRLPFMEVVLDDINERSVGEFMQFKMIEMMYLGRLLNVDTFNQPNVESYKRETREILNK